MIQRWLRRKFLQRVSGVIEIAGEFRGWKFKLKFLEDVMQMAITFMAVVGGMVFSLAVALLAEELIFGQVFRLFFAPGKLAPQTATVKSEQKP
jgi:hypothetical protein